MSVPRIPPLFPFSAPQLSRTRTGDPVMGSPQWYQYARQMLWLNGAGSTLVAAGPEKDDLAPGSDHTFKYYAWPHAQNTYRMWCISLGCDDDGGALGEVKDLAGVSFANPILFDVPGRSTPRRGRVLTTVIVVENVAAPADGEVGFTISVSSDSADNVSLMGACCYEVPLVASGLEVNTLKSNEPIYDNDDTPELSLRSVQIGTAAEVESARRSCLFSYFREAQALEDTVDVFVALFDSALPVLARKRYAADGAGNRTIEVAALAEGDGVVRITASSGDSVDIAFNAEASPVWITGTLAIDAEDPAELANDGGLQSGTRDMLTVEYKSNGAGPNYIAVYGVCGGEVD